MSQLTRIQMVVHLQAVELFTYCTAEQTVRIAEIAEERRFAVGSLIYSRNDPAESIYCVVEGTVELESGGSRARRVGPHGTFGVREILSDRLREEQARAATEVVVLALGADDFFDLLSNNVEIVKALFRQLLRRPAVLEPEGVPDVAAVAS